MGKRSKPTLSLKELQDLRDAGLASGPPSTLAPAALTKRGNPSSGSLEAERARYTDIALGSGGYQKPRREGAE